MEDQASGTSQTATNSKDKSTPAECDVVKNTPGASLSKRIAPGPSNVLPRGALENITNRRAVTNPTAGVKSQALQGNIAKDSCVMAKKSSAFSQAVMKKPLTDAVKGAQSSNGSRSHRPGARVTEEHASSSSDSSDVEPSTSSKILLPKHSKSVQHPKPSDLPPVLESSDEEWIETSCVPDDAQNGASRPARVEPPHRVRQNAYKFFVAAKVAKEATKDMEKFANEFWTGMADDLKGCAAQAGLVNVEKTELDLLMNILSVALELVCHGPPGATAGASTSGIPAPKPLPAARVHCTCPLSGCSKKWCICRKNNLDCADCSCGIITPCTNKFRAMATPAEPALN